MKLALFASAIALSLTAGAALADGHASGDAAAGESVFLRQCQSCHVIQNGDDVLAGRGKTGPNLFGVLGRQAGTVEGFKYGDSVVAAGEAGLEWNEEQFLTYVADPTAFLRETLDDKRARSKMVQRVRKPEDAADVWAYIVSFEEAATN